MLFLAYDKDDKKNSFHPPNFRNLFIQLLMKKNKIQSKYGFFSIEYIRGTFFVEYTRGTFF
jgi:hypothetical protein